MKMPMYGIKDRLTGFTSPIPLSNDEVALRWFKELTQTDTSIKVSPDDFTLYFLGEFDTEKGTLTADVREVVRNGKV